MRKALLVMAAVCAVSLSAVQAGQFPVKPVTIVVSAAPGGASDMTARIYAQQMEKILGKQFVIVNKPGASCSIGMEYVKNRRPDGYTMGYIPVEAAMIKPLGLIDLSSDDFILIARAQVTPAALTVHKDAPWNSLDEFVAYAKANPKAIKVGNSGSGSIWHIAAAAIEAAADIEFTHVPFEGAAPAVAALMGQNVDAVTVSPTEVKAGLDGGNFKMLAILAEDRAEMAPDVKTAKEMGYDINALAWGAFGLPLNTPPEIVKILEDASRQVLNSEEVKRQFKERGFIWAYQDGEGMTKFAKDQLDFYTNLIPKMGINTNQ